VKRALAAVIFIAACSSSPQASSTTTAAASPAPALSPTPVPTPTASPAPQPLQRVERSLPSPVEETAAASVDGRLYVIGGFNAASQSLTSVYVFDGSRWTAGPSLPLGLDHPSAATLNGKLYVAGGHSNGADSARLLRLDGTRWTLLARMHFARGGHALIAAAGRLWAVGGNSVLGNIGPVEAYDPTPNAWTVVGTLPQPRNHVMGFALGGRVCVAGGRSPTTARVDCLDTSTFKWSRLQNLPAPSSGGGAIVFGARTVAVMGGEDAAETRIYTGLAISTSENTWMARAMLAARHGFELAMFEARAWACGGGSAPGLHPVATCTSVGDPGASEP